MIDVNLLPTQKAVSSRERLVRRVVVGLLGVVTGALVLDLVVFFLFQQLFKKQVADLTVAQSGLTAQVQQYEVITKSLLTVEQKVAGITVVQSFRQDLAAIVSEVLAVMVDGVEMGGLQVGTSGNVSFDAKAAGATALGSFVEKISGTTDTHLTKVTMSNLRQDAGGNYIFQVSALYSPVKEAK